MAVHIVARQEERALDLFGRAIAHHAGAEGVKAGVVVPAHGNVREIGEGEALFQPRPLGLHFRQQIGIIAVHIGEEMHELIVRGAVEAQRMEFLGPHALAAVHAAYVGHGVVPHGELQVQPGQAILHAGLAEPVQRAARRVHAAQALHELGNVVNHEHGLAVDGVVVRQMEVFFDHPPHGALEFRKIHAAIPDERAQIVAGALIPQGHRVVVGPHEIEFHLAVVFGLEEAVV